MLCFSFRRNICLPPELKAVALCYSALLQKDEARLQSRTETIKDQFLLPCSGLQQIYKTLITGLLSWMKGGPAQTFVWRN